MKISEVGRETERNRGEVLEGKMALEGISIVT